MGIIYVVTCLTTGKKYVGKTIRTLEQRKKGHMVAVASGSSTAFHNAIRKYGGSAFVWAVRTEARTEEYLTKLEIATIAVLNTKVPYGYNLTDGGDGLCGCTKITKAKIGMAHRGLKRPQRTDSYRIKMSESRKAFLNSEAGIQWRINTSKKRRELLRSPSGAKLRRKIGKAHKGKVISEEQKIKMRESRKRFLESEAGLELCRRYSEQYSGRKLSKETRAKMSISRMGNKNAVGGILRKSK